MLTADGAAVARFARAHDERLAHFLAEFAGVAPSRPVVLATGQGAYLYLLGDAIRAVLAEEPTRLRLINCDHRQMLACVRTGQAHLGVGVLAAPPDDLSAVELASFPQTLLVPDGHRLARRRSVALRDLAGASLVLPPRPRPHRTLLERSLAAARVDWTVAVEAEGWPLITHFVALGVGVAVVNGCVLGAARAGRPAGHRPAAGHLPRGAPAGGPVGPQGRLACWTACGHPRPDRVSTVDRCGKMSDPAATVPAFTRRGRAVDHAEGWLRCQRKRRTSSSPKTRGARTSSMRWPSTARN
nr:hypothetical protein GCM10020092_067120 [Actinoplanes digitatis]